MGKNRIDRIARTSRFGKSIKRTADIAIHDLHSWLKSD